VIEIFPALFYKDLINLLSNVVANNEIAVQGIAILMYVFWLKLCSTLLRRLNDYFFIPFEWGMQEDVYNKVFSYFQQHSTQFFTDNFTGSLISKIRKCT
jgi:ABC-type multidrug transport system fused ATPase/permease subunit